MRRLVLAAAAVAAVALGLAACGSSGSSGDGATPLASALSFVPKTSPMVMTVQTAPNSSASRQAQALEHANPSFGLLMTAAFSQLAKLGIDYNRDIRPLFGNPIVVGAGPTTISGDSSPVVFAWVTKDASALNRLIKKLPGLSRVGRRDGATIYSTGAAGGTALAVSGATVILSSSQQPLQAALDRHAAKRGITSAEYASFTSDIPSNGLITAFGDLTNAMSAPSAATARRVPWVAAIRRYAVSISTSRSEIALHYHIDTGGRRLSVSQLPIASGSTAPGLVGSGPIQVGLRDPSQVVSFIENAVRETNPASYAAFQRRMAQLKRRSGFDLQALSGMLTGQLNVESDTRTSVGRAQVSDPARARTMLAKLSKAEASGAVRTRKAAAPCRAAPSAASDAAPAPLHPLGGGLYSLPLSSSGSCASPGSFTLGVIGDQLVMGRASPAQLRAFARAPVTPGPGAGAVVFRVALSQLLRSRLGATASPAAQQLTGLLGDLTGSASATTAGLTGSAVVALR